MISVTIRLEGAERILAKCNARTLIEPPLLVFQRGASQAFLQATQAVAPRKTGRLAAGHRATVEGPYRSTVTNTVPYAIFVHQGTRPHWMPPGILPFPVMRAIAMRGTRAQPWFERGFQSGMSAVPGLVSQLGAGIAARWGG